MHERRPREVQGNQNYLNFIRKNHQLITDEINLNLPHKGRSQPQDEHISSNFHFPSAPRDLTSHNERNGRKVIHDSLSKFQLGGSPLNQISEIYKMGENSISYDQSNNTIYQLAQRRNDEIAASLLEKQGKSKSTYKEAAKELLFHLNKNRSTDAKKVEFKGITLDRYQSIQEPPAVQLNFKFPIIERKNVSTLVVGSETYDKHHFKEELRERMRAIDKREKIKIEDRSEVRTEKGVTQESREIKKERQSMQKRYKMREELYGLLPVFRTPSTNNDSKKNRGIIINKNKLKIEASPTPSKELVEEYLEENMILKSLPISSDRPKKAAIFNSKEILDASGLDIKDQLSFMAKHQSSDKKSQAEERKMTIDVQAKGKEGQQESIQMVKQQQQKGKAKKPAVTELRYEGDLSIYDLKIRHYREFLFMVNLAHRIYDPILLRDYNTFKPENKYKYYLGKGNNYLLVKSLLKRRFWWTVEEDPKKANFAWTQLKLNYFYQYEAKTANNQKNHKLDCDYQVPQSPKKKKKNKKEEIKLPVKAGIFKAPLPPNDRKIFTICDKKYYDEFLQQADNPEKLLKYSNRLKSFPENFFRSRPEDISNERIHNHLEYNYFIGNKKALFYNLKQFYDLQKKNVFDVIPLTYHIKHGTSDVQYEIFTKEFKRIAREISKKSTMKNIWIVKPGELSNRGQGITVIDEIYELNNILKKKEKHFNGTEKTYIVQKYIDKPLLYKGRKFDIRHYMLITRLHGVMRAYWFGEGYIRTSSHEFNLNQIGDQIIHLTNDAIQKYSEGYGKYEEGNKVSYNEFQRYMDSVSGQGKFSFADMIYPKMRSIALDAVKATYLKLDPNNSEHNFEVFGLDFMIDANYDVWLIEVNTNPCLELSSKLLGRIIPTMVEQSLRLSLDLIFPPPTHYPNSQKYLAPDNPLQRLQFELIFDQDRDGKQIESLYEHAGGLDMGAVDEQDETYQNDGKQIELDNQIE